MIATGTDVKPLECLLFMRDVKSRNYFEQMKGRGTRTLDARRSEEGHAVGETAKTHYVIVDAIGVTKSLKTASQPLITKPSVPLQRPRDGRDDGRARRGYRQLARRPPCPARTSSSMTRSRRASRSKTAASRSPISSADCSPPSIPTASKRKAAKFAGGEPGEEARTKARDQLVGGRGADFQWRADRAARFHPPRQRTDHRSRQSRFCHARGVGRHSAENAKELRQDFRSIWKPTAMKSRR